MRAPPPFREALTSAKLPPNDFNGLTTQLPHFRRRLPPNDFNDLDPPLSPLPPAFQSISPITLSPFTLVLKSQISTETTLLMSHCSRISLPILASIW